MTTIDDLVRRVPPPAEPLDGHGDWAAAETALRLSLPADFKALVERYGRGEFCDLVSVLPPFGAHTLIDQNAEPLDYDRENKAEFPEDYPYPLYPEPGGLVVWGRTSNGKLLCWLTDGSPDGWPVVVWDQRGTGFERYEMGAVAFIDGWLSGQVGPFPTSFTATAQWFDQPRELAIVTVRLTDGELPYPRRLQILRAALAPTADRNSVETDDGNRQDHFAATEALWKVTYETAYGHQIRVAFPPADNDHARDAILRATELMGCQVLTVRHPDGTPAWSQPG